MINAAKHKYFVVINGNVLTEGYSLDLAKGQFGIFELDNPGPRGLRAVKSFAGKPKDTLYQMRLGVGNRPVTRSQDNKPLSSAPFTVEDVRAIGVKAPTTLKTIGDEVILGYNGIDDDTALKMYPGEHYKVTLKLSGDYIASLGYEDGEVIVEKYIAVPDCDLANCEDCDECTEADIYDKVKQLIEDLRNEWLVSGVSVSEVVDITPIRSCESGLDTTTEDYKFYTLTVPDSGGANALAIVQAQYPGKIIERVDRKGILSVYQLVQPESEQAPGDFTEPLSAVIAECNTCPDGWTAEDGGYVYSINIEDEGADKSADIEATFPHAIAGTVKKQDEQEGGIGFYTIMTSQKLTEDEIATWIDSNPTAVVDFVGDAAKVCTIQGDTISWQAGETCQVNKVTFTIDLPDTECGEDRLAELQGHYPEYDIQLEGTSGGCQHRYKATVPSELVCEECDPIFKDYFHVKAPDSYEGREWVMSETEPTNCKLGIRFKGKVMQFVPDKVFIDEMPYIEDGVKVEVSGGFVDTPEYNDKVSKPFHVERIRTAVRRDNLGADFAAREKESRAYFDVDPGNYQKRALNNDDYNIELTVQYIDYFVSIKHSRLAGYMGLPDNEYITYHIIVEVGKEKALEDLINELAAAAGLERVNALGQ